jgi:hypothetical protein
MVAGLSCRSKNPAARITVRFRSDLLSEGDTACQNRSPRTMVGRVVCAGAGDRSPLSAVQVYPAAFSGLSFSDSSRQGFLVRLFNPRFGAKFARRFP